MSRHYWMPLFVNDYRGDTAHLSAIQHGGYLLLIMHYWMRGSLPTDDEQLARIACMTDAEWRQHRPVIQSFFQKGWKHRRIAREIAAAEERSQRRANAGRKGNAVRWGKSQSDPNAIARGSQSQSQSQTQQKKTPSQEGENLSGLGASTDFTGHSTADEETVRGELAKAIATTQHPRGNRPKLTVIASGDGEGIR